MGCTGKSFSVDVIVLVSPVGYAPVLVEPFVTAQLRLVGLNDSAGGILINLNSQAGLAWEVYLPVVDYPVFPQ